MSSKIKTEEMMDWSKTHLTDNCRWSKYLTSFGTQDRADHLYFARCKPGQHLFNKNSTQMEEEKTHIE